MRGVTAGGCKSITTSRFQLTRLMRGVTLRPLYYVSDSDNFNSHASCEA